MLHSGHCFECPYVHICLCHQVLSSLRKIFSECLERNKKAPELEQLSRQDFIVDRDMHGKLLAEGMDAVGVVRKQIENDTLKMKLLRERILASTQERMHVRGATLIGIKNADLEVSSYPLLPPNSGPDAWKLKKVRHRSNAQHHNSVTSMVCAKDLILPLSKLIIPPNRYFQALMLRRVEMKAQRQQFHINGDLAYRVTLDADGGPVPDRRLAQLEVRRK